MPLGLVDRVSRSLSTHRAVTRLSHRAASSQPARWTRDEGQTHLWPSVSRARRIMIREGGTLAKRSQGYDAATGHSRPSDSSQPTLGYRARFVS